MLHYFLILIIRKARLVKKIPEILRLRRYLQQTLGQDTAVTTMVQYFKVLEVNENRGLEKHKDNQK